MNVHTMHTHSHTHTDMPVEAVNVAQSALVKIDPLGAGSMHHFYFLPCTFCCII